MYQSGKFTKTECVMDSLFMIFAGFDTTSRTISSIMYHLKKSPDKLDKLKQELEKAGLFDVENKTSQELLQAYQECDYLTYVFKEGLRVDCPATATLTYEVQKDIEICGVKLEKGLNCLLSIFLRHMNPEQYQRPSEFIPERFDPQSDLFFKPGTKDVRHPMSFAPFSFGLRNCAGQSLAKLEVKVLLARLLEKVDYDIDEDLLSGPDKQFNIFEARDLMGKVNQTYYS